MPNRTIYLPDDLDVVSRQLGLNLSQVTQRAIEEAAAQRGTEATEARADAASARIEALGLDWPEDALRRQRAEAGER